MVRLFHKFVFLISKENMFFSILISEKKIQCSNPNRYCESSVRKKSGAQCLLQVMDMHLSQTVMK